MGRKKQENEIEITNVNITYGEQDFLELVATDFVRWANENGIGIKLK